MEIKTLWIVTKPTGHSTLEDLYYKYDLKTLASHFSKNLLDPKEIEATFTEESEAKGLAEKLVEGQPATAEVDERFRIAAFLNAMGVEVIGMQIDSSFSLDVLEIKEVYADLKAEDYGDAKGNEPEAKDLKRLADIEDKAGGNSQKALQLAENVAKTIMSEDKAVRRAKAAKIAIQDKKLGKQVHDVFMKRAKQLAA